jgi:hypothetical protein
MRRCRRITTITTTCHNNNVHTCINPPQKFAYSDLVMIVSLCLRTCQNYLSQFAACVYANKLLKSDCCYHNCCATIVTNSAFMFFVLSCNRFLWKTQTGGI